MSQTAPGSHLWVKVFDKGNTCHIVLPFIDNAVNTPNISVESSYLLDFNFHN